MWENVVCFPPEIKIIKFLAEPKASSCLDKKNKENALLITIN